VSYASFVRVAPLSDETSLVRITEKHPLWIRWTHWINFPVLFLMIWSGFLIYWANDIYRPFFPNWFYNFFHIPHRLAEGMAIHFSMAWLFCLNGISYFTYLIISGVWRELFPDKKSWVEALHVAAHDMGFKTPLPVQGKFNAAQRITYTIILFMGFGSIATGFAIYKPTQLYWLTWILGGYEVARFLHFALTIGYCLFFVVHLAQVIRAGWKNFQSMVTGYETD
jgi:thiosulfate reductase cytochrome b subunit